MSRIVQDDESPGIKITSDDVTGISESVDELSEVITELCDKVELRISDKTLINEITNLKKAILLGNQSLIAKLEGLKQPKKSSKWTFKIVRDQFGDLEKIEAIEIKDH